MRWLLATTLLLACSQPAPPPRPPSSVPSDTAAPAPPPDAAPPPTPWQRRCIDALTAARPAAAAHAAALATAFVEHELTGDREVVTMLAHAPYHDVAPTYVVVVRTPAPEGEDAGWHIEHAESRDRRYFVTHARAAGTIAARVTLDGWDPRAADALAPVLTAAADRCFD